MYDYGGSVDAHRGIDMRMLWRAARRNWKLILLPMVATIILASAYVATAQRKYTATTTIIIEANNYRALNKDDAGDDKLESNEVDSQVEVIKSQRVVQAVIDRLKLQNDPELQRVSLTQRLRELVGEPRPALTPEAVMDAFGRMMDVKRVDKTYTIDISVTSVNGNKAVVMANALADAYRQQLLDARFEDTQKATEWLQERLADLKQQSLEADQEIQQYRSSNNLVTTGGRLINDQQLSQLNEQYVTATVEAAKAEARLARIRYIIDNRIIDANVTDSLNSPIITELRTKYLTASKRAQDLSQTLGSDHVLVAKLKRDLQNYEGQIFEELKRISQSYASDVQIAKARVDELSNALKSTVSSSVADNENLIALQEKERESEILKTQYQNYLGEYQQLQQQKNFPIASARVITRASTPSFPSQPRIRLVLALALVGGLGIGAGIAVFKESSDNRVRTPADLRSRFDLKCCGVVPDYKMSPQKQFKQNEPTRLSSAKLTAAALDYPLSRVADVLRAVKLTLDQNAVPGCRIIGVTSISSDEGKTFIASNLAITLGMGGASVLLVDADLRRHGVSQLLARDARRGLIDVIERRSTQLSEMTVPFRRPNISILPAPLSRGIQPNSAELLASAAMRSFLIEASQTYDYIVLDLPPAGPLIDAKAMADVTTDFVFVTSWGKTSFDDIEEFLRNNAEIAERNMVTVINRSNPRLQRLYSRGDVDYLSGYY